MQAFSCLMYHNVCSDGSLEDPTGEWSSLSPSIRSYFVEESAFSAHMSSVMRSCDLITLDKVKNFFNSPMARSADPGLPDARPSTLITFDDGWRGTLELAAPILQRHAAEATVFMTSNLLDTPGFLKASELHQLPSQLRIGSHCKTHRFLNEMSETEIREELLFSKSELERLSSREVISVAIPNGAVDDRVRRIAMEIGYSLVFTSDVHQNSHWTGADQIGRAAVRTSTSTNTVRMFAEGHYGIDPIRSAVLSFPKRLLGPKRYRRWRAWCLGEKSTHQEMHDLCPLEPVYHVEPSSDETAFRNRDAEVARHH